MSVFVGKEVSVVMEYNRQVPFGGAVAAEAAKARNQTVEMRDMAFATVTIAEKDGSGQQRSSNVCLSPTLHLAVGCQTLYSVCYASLVSLTDKACLWWYRWQEKPGFEERHCL